MPPALTGVSCVTWRIADDPAELGHPQRERERHTGVRGEQVQLDESEVDAIVAGTRRQRGGHPCVPSPVSRQVTSLSPS